MKRKEMPQVSLYEMGMRYCRGCAEWYKTEAIRCEDCNAKLRIKPHSVKSRYKQSLIRRYGN